MKIRILAVAAVVLLIFDIVSARRLWRRTLSLSRNVNRSSPVVPSSPSGALRRIHGQTIFHQPNSVIGLNGRRQAMAAKINSVAPFAKPLPVPPLAGSVWVKVYGEANANKTDEKLLDVEAHTEIIHIGAQTSSPRQLVEDHHDLSLSGYGPPLEETGATKVDQQAGSMTDTQEPSPAEVENPYGGGAPVATEPKQPTAITLTTAPATGEPTTGVPSVTGGEEVTGTLITTPATGGPGVPSVTGGEEATGTLITAPATGEPGVPSVTGGEEATGLSETSTKATEGSTEFKEASTTSSEGITGSTETSTGIAQSVTTPSESYTASKEVSIGSTERITGQSEGPTESGEESIGRAGEATSGPSESATGLQEGGETSSAAGSGEVATTSGLIESTGTEEVGTAATSGQETESSTSPETPGTVRAPGTEVPGTESTGVESRPTESSAEFPSTPETEPTNLSTGPADFGYGGGPETTEGPPSSGEVSTSSSSSIASQPSKASEARPTTTSGIEVTGYGPPSISTGGEEAKTTEHLGIGGESSETPQVSTEEERASQETTVESTALGSTIPDQKGPTEAETAAPQILGQTTPSEVEMSTGIGESTQSTYPLVSEKTTSELLSSPGASSVPGSTSSEETGITGVGITSVTQPAEGIPGYGEPEGATEIGTGLPGLSRGPATQLTKSIEEATTVSGASEGTVETGEEAKTTPEGAVTKMGVTGGTGTAAEQLKVTTEVTSEAGVSETTKQVEEAQTTAERLPGYGAVPESTTETTKRGEEITELPEISQETAETSSEGTTGTSLYSYETTPSNKAEGTGLTVEKTVSGEAVTVPSGEVTSHEIVSPELSSRVTESSEASTAPTGFSERTITPREEISGEGTTEEVSGAGGEGTGGGLAGYGEVPEATTGTAAPRSTEAEFGTTEGSTELPKSSEEVTAIVPISSEGAAGTSVYSYETTPLSESTEIVTGPGEKALSTEISTELPGVTTAKESGAITTSTEGLTETKQELPFASSEGPSYGGETAQSGKEITAISEGTTPEGGEETTPERVTVPNEVESPGPSGRPSGTETTGLPETSEGVTGSSEGTLEKGEETMKPSTEEVTPGASEGASPEKTETTGRLFEETTGPGEKTTVAGLPESTTEAISRPTEYDTETSAGLPVSVSESIVTAPSITTEKTVEGAETTSTLQTEPTNVPAGPEDFGYGGGHEGVTEKHPSGSTGGLLTSVSSEKATESKEETGTAPSSSVGGETTEIPKSSETSFAPSEGAESSRPPVTESSEGALSTEVLTSHGVTETSASIETVPEYGTTEGAPETSEPEHSTETGQGTTTELPRSTEGPIGPERTSGGTVVSAELTTAKTSTETSASEGTIGLPGLMREGTSVQAGSTPGAHPMGKGFAEMPGSTPPPQTEPTNLPTGPGDFGYGGGNEEVTERLPSGHAQVAETSTTVAESVTITAVHPETEKTTALSRQPSVETSRSEGEERGTTAPEATIYSTTVEIGSTSRSEEAEREMTAPGAAIYSTTVEISSTSSSVESFASTGTISSESRETSKEGETASYGASEETPEAGVTQPVETGPVTVPGQKFASAAVSTSGSTEAAGETTGPETTPETSLETTQESGGTITGETGSIPTSVAAGATPSGEPSHITESKEVITGSTELASTTESGANVPAKIPMGPEDFGYGGGNEVTVGSLTSVTAEFTTLKPESSLSTEQTNLIETSTASESSASAADGSMHVASIAPGTVPTSFRTETSTAPEATASLGSAESSIASETTPSLRGAETPETSISAGASSTESVPSTTSSAVTHELATMLTTAPTSTEIIHSGENLPAKIPTGPEDFGYGDGATEPSNAASDLSPTLEVNGKQGGNGFPENHQSAGVMAVVSDTAEINNLPELRRPKKVFSNLPLQKVDDTTKRKWRPYTLDCAVEVDEKGNLCREWAKAGLCETHRPTMFLFCRRTCLCVGPPMDLLRRLRRL